MIVDHTTISVVNYIEPSCRPVKCLFSHYIRIKFAFTFVAVSPTFFFFLEKKKAINSQATLETNIKKACDV